MLPYTTKVEISNPLQYCAFAIIIYEVEELLWAYSNLTIEIVATFQYIYRGYSLVFLL